MPLNGFVKRSWIAISCLSQRNVSCFSDFRSGSHWNNLSQLFLSLFTCNTEYRKDLTDFSFEGFYLILNHTLRFTWLHISELLHISILFTFEQLVKSQLITEQNNWQDLDIDFINDRSMAQMLNFHLWCVTSPFQMKRTTPAEWFLTQ